MNNSAQTNHTDVDRSAIDQFAWDTVPYLGPASFMRAPMTRDATGIDVAVIGLAYDLGTSHRTGTRFGPRGIREQSLMVGQYPDGVWPWPYQVMERLKVIDWGDIPFMWGERDDFLASCQHHLRNILDTGATTLGLGGDHFVFYPLIKAHSQKHGPLAVVHFDAHDDCFEVEQLNHATMFYHASKNGWIDPAVTVHVGIRTPFASSAYPYNYIDGIAVQQLSSQQIAQNIKKIIGSRPVYVTFDIDFVDPAFAPGTGTCCVGGVNSYKAREILRELKGLNVIAADIVEVAPPLDSSQITQVLGAAIAADLLYLIAEGRKLTPNAKNFKA